MNCPSTYSPEQLKQWAVSAEIRAGYWVAARPCGWQGLALRLRLKAAWLVFTGRCDVLQWYGQ